MYFYVSSGRALDLIYIPGRRIVRQVVHTHVLHVPLSLKQYNLIPLQKTGRVMALWAIK